MKRLRTYAALGVLLAATACRRAAPPPPAVSSVREPLAPAIPESRFEIPLTYDITKVLAKVERAVPRQFGSMDSVHQAGDDDSKHYAYQANRGPFTAFGDSLEFHLRATVTYQARGYYKPRFGPTLSAGCGTSTDHPPRMVVELATPLTLSSDWHLVSHARVVSVRPASNTDRDRCEVRLLHYDVTDRIVDAARAGLTGRLPEIDRSIDDVDLTGQVTQWWGLLSRPIRLTDGVWLLLSPVRLRMGAVRGHGRTLTVRVGLDARPKIVTADSEPVVILQPLPPLAPDERAKGFHILIEGIVDYATASQALSDALRGAVVTEQGHTVTVDSAIVAPEPNGRLSLLVAFHGDAKGTLRLVGLPTLDPAKGRVMMPDLDYDLHTASPLINAYSWLASIAMRSVLRDRAVLPVGPALEKGRDLLLQGLNRKIGDAMTLAATINSVSARSVFVTRRGLVLRAEAIGQATAVVRER